MKKSEIYQFAMLAVLNSEYCNVSKLEIIAELMERKSLAEFTERQEEK